MFVAISSRPYEIWIALGRSRRPAAGGAQLAACRLVRPAQGGCAPLTGWVVELGNRLRASPNRPLSYNGKSDPLHATMRASPQVKGGAEWEIIELAAGKR